MDGSPVVVLTALNLEYQAIRDQLVRTHVHRHRAGTRFEVGTLAGGRCRIALALVGKGNNPAAVLAERAMAEFDPQAVLFVGVAGSLWPGIALGDVVVATHVYAYHGGTSEDDGLKARPRVWEVPHEPDQIARHLARDGGWARRLPPTVPVPPVHFGPIAAGEVVQDSAVAAHAVWVRQHYNDALAIEMEAAGVAQAGHLNRSLPVVVVRGISDMADGTKTATDGVNWQPRAVANAAAFAVALAEQLSAERRADQRVSVEANRRSAGMGPTFNNTAKDNARVGMQVGVVEGDVHASPAAAGAIELSVQLADLRAAVERAREHGRLDEDTYAAARAELDVATEAADAPAPQRRAPLLMALRRLGGLVGDLADLAAKVAAVVAVVKGMS
ncbi:5'-methylthioadenosine/S-adenosylhomocysteine nucleosidase [Dactylosporangium aurantiacum]|uniref:5'-methylthioadenosine/S-adenosylhomocysteine nucleosidase n=1 Tax=Dactylosporangium aurantiacum TaxID=35754 RepID=A0A9Q9IBJ4_9ACTN|nr:5'-methylthioadenosine/S-adenosylhomocysteine nucleosidase [Dactylosporangium aurantiacum]MDG6101405.1 5'-methylthioadenosine/S-adenosylhomocysteine nucleosidase [Dactylosporangium aurantiacum]UWZ52741.1 5'-methylthioadenosine/S-adenosylhomocysteine nucleosidase [Dactylosporangium aurantiacum]